MTSDQAEKAVTASAFVVAGVYGYRRLTGDQATKPGNAKAIVAGQDGQLVPLGQFVTAWGFAFLVVSIMAEVAPGFGAGFAMLIATTDFLANAPALFNKVQTGVGPGFDPSASSVGTAATQSSQGAQALGAQAVKRAGTAGHAGVAGAGNISHGAIGALPHL